MNKRAIGVLSVLAVLIAGCGGVQTPSSESGLDTSTQHMTGKSYATVSGQVTNFPGNHRVYLCPDNASDPLTVYAQDDTDEDGNFQFTLVQYPALYKVSVDGIWFCSPVIVVNGPTINQDVTAVLTTAQADPPTFPFTCSGPPTIPVPSGKAALAGKITNPTGSGHTIKACDSSGVTKFSGNSNTGSWYRLIVDTPGTYYMKIDDTWCTTATKTISVPADPDGTRHDIALP